MASSPSPLLKLEFQATGDNDETWGDIANVLFGRLEEAIAGTTNITVTAADYTLDDTQYLQHDDGANTSESHVAAIKATGTLTGNRNVIVPSRSKVYWVWNATGGAFSLTVKTSAGTGVVVPQGYLMAVICDGTNVEALTAPVDSTGTDISISTINGVNAATAQFVTAQETKLGHITVTQAVDLDAIETRVNALDASVILMGTWDASVGTFPGGGTAQAGESWIVSVGGTVDSQVFVANDRIIAITDNASTTTYASNWHQADYTDQVLSVNSRTGAVVLDPDDLDDTSTTNKFASTANVTAAGAFMDSEATNLAALKALDQGLATTDSPSWAKVQATGDTSAGDAAAIGYTATEGLILTGQGSSNDVTIKNDADTDVITIPTGGTAVNIAGKLSVGMSGTTHAIQIAAGADVDAYYGDVNGNWFVTSGNMQITNPSGAGQNALVVTQQNSGSDCAFFDGPTGDCYIRTDGDLENTNNAYGAISDVKLKEKISKANSQWADVKALGGIVSKFNFIGSETQHIGFIAQEVEAISPGLVQDNPDKEEVEVPVVDENGDPVVDEVGVVDVNGNPVMIEIEPAKAAVFEAQEKQVTITEQQEQTTIEFIDGVPTRITKLVDVEVPQFGDAAPLVTSSGTTVLDDAGQPIMCPVPIMETVQVEVEPAKEAVMAQKTEPKQRMVVRQKPTGDITKSVKYSIAYMKAFKALGEAMERIEALEIQIENLNQRLKVLENV